MNEDLQQLHRLLLAQHRDLAKRLSDETEPAMADALLGEMRELLPRISRAQNLLFRQSAESLAAEVKKIRAADTQLIQALNKARKAGQVVKAIRRFLGRVDKLLDLARTLAV